MGADAARQSAEQPAAILVGCADVVPTPAGQLGRPFSSKEDYCVSVGSKPMAFGSAAWRRVLQTLHAVVSEKGRESGLGGRAQEILQYSMRAHSRTVPPTPNSSAVGIGGRGDCQHSPTPLPYHVNAVPFSTHPQTHSVWLAVVAACEAEEVGERWGGGGCEEAVGCACPVYIHVL
jgi:hypothetical protein